MKSALFLLTLTLGVAFTTYARDVDMVLFNGEILTQDAQSGTVQAMAISGDRILATGNNAAIQRLAGAHTRQIDLRGKTVIPGLNDTHTHAIRAGQTFQQENYWYDITNVPAAIEQLQRTARERGKNQWVSVAGAWHPDQFREKRAPTVAELTAAMPENPVYVQYLYDYALLNRQGIGALGLNAGKAYSGITVERDQNGNATGKITGDIAAFSALFNKIMPVTPAQRKASLLAFFNALSQTGITSLTDAAGGGSGMEIYSPLFTLWRDKQLPLRVAYRVSAQKPGNELAWFRQTLAYLPAGLGDHQLKFAGMGELLVPGMNDGARQGPGFSPPASAREMLKAVATFAAENRYPLEIHAYTDDAGKQILDVFEEVNKSHPIGDLRWAIAHLNTGSAETFARMKKLGMIYTVQMGPFFESSTIAQTNSKTVAEAAPPIRLALEAGLRVAGGTDATRIGTPNVWQAIEYDISGTSVGGAVQREVDKRLSREEALTLYTRDAAYVTFEEDEKGTLRAGKLADFAVLNAPYLTMPVNEIHRLKSVMTVMGGKIVWQQPNL